MTKAIGFEKAKSLLLNGWELHATIYVRNSVEKTVVVNPKTGEEKTVRVDSGIKLIQSLRFCEKKSAIISVYQM